MTMMAHPLDQLNASEVSITSRLVNEYDRKRRWIFNSITLFEPPKYEILEKSSKGNLDSIPRKSIAMLIDKNTGIEYEVIVNINREKVESLNEITDPEAHLNLSGEDCVNAEKIVLADPNVQRRCAELGFKNMKLVVADAWGTGYIKDRPELLLGKNQRLVRCFMYGRLFENDNMYAHPLNFTTIADVLNNRVVDIQDLPVHCAFEPKKEEGVTVPMTPVNYDPDFLPKDFMRKDLKPLQVTQPQGPSFKVTGNRVEWQNFSFHVGFNYREGLVLHEVSYNDKGRVRPLFYRIALAEMAVPYGDPRPPYHVKCALDAGDCGLGNLADSLELGCDCLGNIYYFDGILNNHAGEGVIMKNCICLHEEDAGILFKHTEYRNGKDVTTRSRRLVISFICSIVNYDYAFYWSFYQDGSIGFEAKATGIMSTSLLAPGEDSGDFATLVSPGVNAQYHQHIFAVRLDTMIDGVKNQVSTVDVIPLPLDPKTNPYSSGFTIRETLLKSTVEAATDASTETSRFWKISNPNVLNPITGTPVAYKLMAGNTHQLMALPQSYIWEKVGFTRHAVWVLPYTDNIEERYPDGRFVYNRNGNYTGLHKWVEENKNIVNEDVVLWHVFGITHIPRVEDFPIMPVETASFMLKPYNFFNANPALDVKMTNKGENGSVKVIHQNKCC